MKYIYGPINSRRLGLSLGVSLTPYKICSFDCIYCQLGKTTDKTKERKEYATIQEIINELKLWLQNNNFESSKINYITLSGSGEPTLNIKIDQLIVEVKKIVSLPIAVITNSSILHSKTIREAIFGADLIIPSLDAAVSEIFEKIDRPQEDIKIDDIIAGLVSLRKEFRGKIWLEIMLVKDVNDDLRHIRKLKDIALRINPDKIHLNSPVRTTSEKNIFPLDKNKLEKIKDILGDKCEII